MNLSLNNFKGVKSFTLDANAADIAIRADNGKGKTSIVDAFNWLLFDKDSKGKSDFGIKTLASDGKPIHKLEHSVEGVFDIKGKKLNLKKIFMEKWTKKRGSTTEEFAGHTTTYHINGKRAKKTEYDICITRNINKDIFELLTSPTYFNEQLHWKDRRDILMGMCDNITDVDIIKKDKRFAELADILNNYTVEEYQKEIKEKSAEIDKDLQKIDVRIEENNQSLENIADLNEEQIEKNASKLKKEIRNKELQIARIEEGGEIAEKTKLLREVEAEMLGIQNKYQLERNKKMQETQDKLHDIKGKISDLTIVIDKSQKILQDNKYIVVGLDKKMDIKRQEWADVNAEQFEFTQEEICPTCKQALPKKQLEEARENATVAFNQNKASRLESITTEGKIYKKQKEEVSRENEDVQDKLKKSQKDLRELNKKEDAANKELEGVRASFENYTNDSAYQEKLKKKKEIGSAIEELKGDKSQEIESICADVGLLQDKLDEAEKQIAVIVGGKQNKERIAELELQKNNLAKEFEELERMLYIIDEFVRTKVKILEEEINNKFQLARFKLFNILVNGTVEMCCETLYDGVPYGKSLNSGHKIIVGLDIIRTLSDHYGFYPVIFVDNAESITDAYLPKMKSQVIRLIKPDIETKEEQEKYSKLIVDIKEKEMHK